MFPQLSRIFSKSALVFSTNLCPASQWLSAVSSFLVYKYPRGKCLTTSSFKPKDLFIAKICWVSGVTRCPELPALTLLNSRCYWSTLANSSPSVCLKVVMFNIISVKITTSSLKGGSSEPFEPPLPTPLLLWCFQWPNCGVAN